MAAIIFDMDGTIADSFDFVVDYVALKANRYPLTDNQRQALRGYSMAAIVRQLGLPWWRMIGLFYGGRRRMGRSMHQIAPFAGMPELLRKLHAEGHELFLVSSNSVRNVRNFLRQYHLQEHFLEVYGSVGFFSKSSALRKLLQEQNLEPANCVYVGDELRDVQASQSVGIRVVAVSWGFSNPKIIAEHKPTYTAHTPTELLEILELI